MTSEDAPALGGVYKLVEIEESGVRRRVAKYSAGKGTWPGCKQVWRIVRDGVAVEDVVAFAGDEHGEGAPLLRQVIKEGRRIDTELSLEDARARCARSLAELPPPVRRLDGAGVYPVVPSRSLAAAICSAAVR